MYIPRTLIVAKGTESERQICETDIQSLGQVIVLLGEPGIGKTELTKQLAEILGALRVTAGTLIRTADPSKFSKYEKYPLIIDGLDEITISNEHSAIDQVLTKLSLLNYPNIIISCRAADWTGTTNKYKFVQDYHVEPITIDIAPLSLEEQTELLREYSSEIHPEQLLSTIAQQQLGFLTGNPLTLKLLAEVWLSDAGLPATKTELLERATQLLVREESPAHDQSSHAMVPPELLLEDAGCLFAHLLLSGAVGITTNSRQNSDDDFIPLAEFGELLDASHSIKTRLFKYEGENKLVPVHRVIAEYLAGNWLSTRLNKKLPERRLFQLLHYEGGVPSALRGLNAWLGYFSPMVCQRCISADPYGFLRYGETKRLSIQNHRYLLNALSKLAEEDPYFRSEDWSLRSVAGIARPELTSEIISLISDPKRNVQLSSLILHSLACSPLVPDLLPELFDIIKDTSATFIERSAATEAVLTSKIEIDWHSLVNELVSQKCYDSSRLAVETIGDIGPSAFTSEIIADALIALYGLDEADDRGTHVLGPDFRLINQTTGELAQSILDTIALKVISNQRQGHWQLGLRITSVIKRLLCSAIDGPSIDPKRFWSWISHFESGSDYGADHLERVHNYLIMNPEFRRDIQRFVLYDETIEGGPWKTIVHILPRSISELKLSVEDAVHFLNEISVSSELTSHQQKIWDDLVRVIWRQNQNSENVIRAIDDGTSRHQALSQIFAEITKPPERDYGAEDNLEREQYESRRIAQFLSLREKFKRRRRQIEAGEDVDALVSLAKGYLGQSGELNNEIGPHERLYEWLGEDLTKAALKGFEAALWQKNLPTLESIYSIRAEGKEFKVERVILAGIAEIVRSGRSLKTLPEETVRAALGIWWMYAEFNSQKLGKEIESALEDFVFQDAARIEAFATTVIETQLSKRTPEITGLYRFVHDKRFFAFSPRLALKWLKEFPHINFRNQSYLIQLVISRGKQDDLLALINERLKQIESMDTDCRGLWRAVAFCLTPSVLEEPLLKFDLTTKEMIWPLKDFMMPDRTEIKGLALPFERYAAIVEIFGTHWPMVNSPIGGWCGDQNPWDASEFILRCINKIGSDRTEEGTKVLVHLCQKFADTNYGAHLKHVLKEQRRNRRDQGYSIRTFEEISKILQNANPTSVSDLKALILDHLEDVQNYVSHMDTDSWKSFWQDNSPQSENFCRDRLIDFLRPRLGRTIDLFPELPMPYQTRVDIYATVLNQGLPIEIKGQWNSDVWNAAKTQLDERYTHDLRTEGFGIYLVLWFGNVEGKNLPNRSGKGAPPCTPKELQQMLHDDLNDDQKSRIDIVVFDVSKPKMSVKIKK